MIRCLLVLLCLSFGLLIALPSEAGGCAVAPHVNQSVEIADESAIIIWDSDSGTQHFIRRATFQSAAQDFGFLVPTPAKPELAEADDAAFKELARVTAPKVVTKPRPKPSGCSIGCDAEKAASVGATPEAQAVRVLEQKSVAGYDAAVLEADNADALAAWLKKHDYAFTDPLKKWAEHYVKAKWKITAFKVSKAAAEQPVVSSAAVRMTFKTDKPFFPYREPTGDATDRSPPRRLLRVFFIGAERAEGRLGNEAWPGRAVWAGEITEADRAKVLGQVKLPPETPPAKWWLTEFEDWSSPRPGRDDLFFQPSADQKPVERPPHIQYVKSDLPGCVMCLAACGLVLGVDLLRRRRAGYLS